MLVDYVKTTYICTTYYLYLYNSSTQRQLSATNPNSTTHNGSQHRRDCLLPSPIKFSLSAPDLSRAFVSPGSRPRLLGGRSPGDTCSCQICKIQSKFIPITNSCKIIFWVFGKCVAYMYLLYKKKKEILKALGFWS